MDDNQGNLIIGLSLLFGTLYVVRTIFQHSSYTNHTSTNPQPSLSLPPNPSPTTAPPPPILKASEHINDNKHHLLLAATGSVATIKLPQIIHALSKHQHLSIRILLTASAAEFLQGQMAEQLSLAEISQLPHVDGIYHDADEWRQPWTRGAAILHIELRRWADLMVIAPLSANGLAKLALGLSDTLVYSVARAWDTRGAIDGVRGRALGTEGGVGGARKKILVAPAMNTAMWNHPITAVHMATLEGWSVANGGWMEVLRPIEKGLACGDAGGGGMREWEEIVRVVEERLGLELSTSVEKERKIEMAGVKLANGT